LLNGFIGKSAAGVNNKNGFSLPLSPSGLKAWFAHDNKRFNYCFDFLGKYATQVPHYPIPIEERIILRVKDKKRQISGQQRNIHRFREVEDE
jgi:hypothetical protein